MQDYKHLVQKEPVKKGKFAAYALGALALAAFWKYACDIETTNLEFLNKKYPKIEWRNASIGYTDVDGDGKPENNIFDMAASLRKKGVDIPIQTLTGAICEKNNLQQNVNFVKGQHVKLPYPIK